LRLNKFIALNLPTSRRKADELIQSGEVIVNGKVPEVGYIVKQNDVVSVNNKKLSNNNTHEYYKFYKPKGYVCSHNKQGSAPTIYDLIGKNYLKFGGRLDKDSEGLMLLSTDGEWLNEIFHSIYNLEKADKENTIIYACGHPDMVTDVSEKCSNKFNFIEEKFWKP